MADLGLSSRYEGGSLLGYRGAGIALLPLARGLGGARTAPGHSCRGFRAVQHAQEDSIRHIRIAHAGTAGASPRTSCPRLPRYILCLQELQSLLPMPQLSSELWAFSVLYAVPTATRPGACVAGIVVAFMLRRPPSCLSMPGGRMRASTPQMEAADPAAPLDTACTTSTDGGASAAS